jgi:hypothetical protein
MEFKIGERIVFTDKFKEVNNEFLKNNRILNEVFIIRTLYNGNVYISLDGKNMIGAYNKKAFRMATENEIKLNQIKRIFIV